MSSFQPINTSTTISSSSVNATGTVGAVGAVVVNNTANSEAIPDLDYSIVVGIALTEKEEVVVEVLIG